jgi:hypothetical protein
MLSSIFEQLSSDTLLDNFSCLVTEYNDYLFNDALRSQNDHIALTWLLREKTTGNIAAYHYVTGFLAFTSRSRRHPRNLQQIPT